MGPAITGELILRPAGLEDTDRILELLKVSLGEGIIPREIDYWSWKHLTNPFGPSPTFVADAGGRIVGLRVFMRWDWRSAGEVVPAVRAVDTATHPAWRGQGIFTRLTLDLVERMREEGIAFVFNTPNNLSRPGYLKMGWSRVGRVSMWIQPRHPIRLMRSVVHHANENGKPPIGAATLEQDLQPAAELLRQPEMEGLLDDIRSGEERFHTPPSMAYLQWRYAEIPAFQYYASWSLEKGDGTAIIFRVKQHGRLRELRICELLVGATHSSIRSASHLLRKVMGETRPDYTAAIAASRTAERRALVRAGFIPAPRLGPILTVRPLSPRASRVNPLDRSAWRLAIGDLELF